MSELADDLLYYFEEKKRLTNKNYRYVRSAENDKYLKEAAALCKELHMHPGVFVSNLYEDMGKHKSYFSPKHLRGPNVKKKFTENIEDYRVEITNDTIEYEDLWRLQHELAMLYIRQGESTESVLKDSSLKFFAWFRILATPRPNPEIIDKYKRIAKKEMNPRLVEFIRKEGLDLDRILD
jgi:hypothetical protein